MTELSTHAFHTLDSGIRVEEGTVVPYYLTVQKTRIALARVDGRLYAFHDLCTCSEPSCPVSGGLLTGQTVMCQCHGSRFDITTGAVLDGPATAPIAVFESQETDGRIRVRL